jgi:hypothetical protein
MMSAAEVPAAYVWDRYPEGFLSDHFFPAPVWLDRDWDEDVAGQVYFDRVVPVVASLLVPA